MNRLRNILIIGAIILIGSTGYSQEVGIDAAKDAAQNWVRQKSSQSIESVQLVDSVVQNQQTLLYRFGLIPEGFIWVSGDYRNAPVLAYSFEGKDPSMVDGHPVEDFLDLYESEILGTKEQAEVSTIPHEGWLHINQSAFKSGNSDEYVEPMMEVLWGQGSGYNQLTPDNTPTGCVAVSMVQLMRHWEWPTKPTGQHSYTHDVYGDFAIDFDTITFDWANMPLAAPSLEIAKAMLYTGIALHMNYAPGGSGASVSRAGNLMESTFHFHEKARYASKDDFGATDNWVRILKNELINGRPIIYRGQGTGGHAFNFDGFDGDFFHVNWGWSGSHNGYFLVTSLTPGSNDFSEAQGAVINLFPDSILIWDRPFGVRLLASDSRVSLGWSGVYNGELAYYNIYRDEEIIGQAPERFYTDTTPVNGHVYNYSISAVYRTDTADYESDRTIDAPVQPAAGFTLPFQEDFQENHEGWQIAGDAYGFRWGTQEDLGMGSDSENYFIGINSGQAGNNKLVSDYLISNGFNFEGKSHVVISFDYAFRKWQDVDHLYLMYRNFEDNEWVEIAELEATAGYHEWINYKTYLPDAALTSNIQLCFFYTDNGEVGYGAGIDNIEITEVEDPGKPAFTVSQNINCMNTEVVFTDNSTGTITSYYWDFGLGADPRYADTEGPHTVTYKSSGNKTITLILNGLDKEVKEDYLTFVRPPKAGFSKSISNKTVTFRNTSSSADTYFWNFGDGVQVMQEAPIHTYAKSGDYLVTLVAINETCPNDTIQQWVSFTIAGKDDIPLSGMMSVYPNPVNDWLSIQTDDPNDQINKIVIVDLQGKTLAMFEDEQSIGKTAIQLDLSGYKKGVYFVMVYLQDRVVPNRIIHR